MKKFIVFHTNEDGDAAFDFMTAKKIKEDFLSLNEDVPYQVFDKFPELGYCGEGILIIDGTIVVPKPKEIVKDWDIK